MTKASELHGACIATLAALGRELAGWADSHGGSAHVRDDGSLEVRSAHPDTPHVIGIHRAGCMRNRAAVIVESGWLLFVPDPVWVGAPRARIPAGDPDPWGTLERMCRTEESLRRYQKAEDKVGRMLRQFSWHSGRMSGDRAEFEARRAEAVRRAGEYCRSGEPYRPAPEKEDKA
jgi:hypothetical protein